MKGTLRQRYRYIAIRMLPTQEIDKFEFEKRLQRSMLSKLGEIQYSLSMPRIITYNRSTAILRTRREGIDQTLLSLAMISKIGTERIHLQSIFVSGSILGCKNKLKKQ